MRRHFGLGAAALTLAPLAAGAQGSLSRQGFGYPPGELSARSLATGGALGEFDPQSPINPGSLAAWGRSGFSLQYAPEILSVNAGGLTERTRTLRFPVIGGALRVSNRLVLGLTAATLLDRTWSTRFSSQKIVAEDTIDGTFVFRSVGAINDIRFAVSWLFGQSLVAGMGVHVLTGRNDTFAGASFESPYQSFSESKIYSFSGAAASVGADWRLSRTVALAASARAGGTMRAVQGDSVVVTADVPARLGGSVRFDGVPGTTIAARVSWDGWSSMARLSSGSLEPKDTWEGAFGVEGAGPRFGERVLTLRGGTRWRTLPFAVSGDQVREMSFAFGGGVPLAGERAALDLTALRARRSGVQGLSETGWTIGVGVTVRP